jgi:hypothetical protein
MTLPQAGADVRFLTTALLFCPEMGERMLERTLVKSLGWPEGRLLTLAHDAGTHLAATGLSGEAILVWLDQVYAEPAKFVDDPALCRLALALLCPHCEEKRDPVSSR